MPFPVEVQVTYSDPQLAALVSIFEANVDLDEVKVTRTDYAIKAVAPFDLVITATSAYFLQKLILAPLIDPAAEKFNWVKAVRKYLKPIQPFRLTVNLADEDLVLEAALEANHDITAEIWSIIHDTLDLLRQENILSQLTKIRFDTQNGAQLLILCYERKRPKYSVDLRKRQITIITSNGPSDGDTGLPPEEWLAKQLEKSMKYQESTKKSED